MIKTAKTNLDVKTTEAIIAITTTARTFIYFIISTKEAQ